jgi:phosphoribosylglycinamide formyltransferase-1
MNIAVFASGSGSNAAAINEAIGAGRLSGVRFCLLITDKPQAAVVERMNRAGIPVFSFVPKDYADKAAYETAVLEELKKHDVDLIVLAGYMRLIGPTLLRAYPNRIINLHPSLLPAFPGKDAIGQALAAGVKVTGITVHFVDEGMDTGPIIAQEPLRLNGSESAEELAARIHQLEHQLLPQVIQWLADGRVAIQGRSVYVRASAAP